MNKINRHNYETFFILYMDNELSSEERLMVEDFVKQYPELKEELDVLMQYKLQPDDDIVFANKESLMMQTPAAATEPDMETRLMLYLDGELNNAEKHELEVLLASNSQMQEVFAVLQKQNSNQNIFHSLLKAAFIEVKQ
jgi:anti-sigma factor RsiW